MAKGRSDKGRAPIAADQYAIGKLPERWIRNPDGTAHVAARTAMIDCKARKVE